ncbi:MAG: DNA-binding protein [Bacteroides sp.]|nr:DNA-binding protein [Bacteroides sp.]
MTKYIKQEVPDMQKTGEQKVFYRLKVERNIDFQEFIHKLCTYHSGISRGEALRVLISTSEVLAELLGEGYSVTLDNWGTFKATLGLEDGKEMDTIDGSESKRNARSLCLNGVNFLADKKLVRNAGRHCKLERAGIVRVKHSPYTKEERLQKALDYLEENKVLKVSQYMELTGQAHTTAACELRAFSRDPLSSIVPVGRGSTVVYVKGETKSE